MSQSNVSEHIRTLKQYIEQKDFDSFNRFLDTYEIPKKTLNSVLCFALQNYRSNYEMMDYINLLIEKGADQNSMFYNKSSSQGQRIDEKDNVSILMYACIYADIRLVESIATEKNINFRDKNGKNALFYVLNDKGEGDNPDVIGALIYHGIDVNCVGKIDVGDKIFESHTALSLAASKNMINSFKTLIEKDSDPNFKVSPTGDTILHIAVKKNNVEMVKLLLNTNKIKFEEKNKENKTALELAKAIGEETIIYKLIKEKIEEGNRQGDIVAQELLSEDKKNIIKKYNEMKNMNLLNVNREKKEISNNLNINKNILNNQNKIGENTVNVNNNKKISKEKSYEKHIEKKIKIFDKYLNNTQKYNCPNNLKIQVTFPKNNYYNNKYNNYNNMFTLDNNNENIPILTIDLLSKEFIDYKNSFVMNNKEKNNLKILEEENAFLKNELDLVKEKNNNLIKSNNEKDAKIKEIENKYQLSINELNKKISFLEKQHENDKNILNELQKEINKKNKNTTDAQSLSNSENNSINNKTITIQYLNKKFINYNINLNFNTYKNNYVINCLSKDLTEFELFVTEHIKKRSNLYEELVKNVQNVVKECTPEYEVHLYGSHATNLCLPWSDLDIVLISKNNNNQISSEDKHLLLSKLYDNLRHQPWVRDTNYISSANIPIIKLISIEKYNSTPIDISIQDEKHFGLRCVDLVKQFMNKYESLKPLVLALKNILKRGNLNDPYKGGMSSYGLILMIVYFLQQQAYSGIDISMNDNNLGQLFFDFIHFYAIEYEFNKSVIYIKNNMNDIDDLKYQNIAHTSGLIIIDPLNTSNNVAKPCFQYLGIRMAFIISLKALLEDCECGCHYSDNSEEYNNLHVEHCFLKRIFNAVKRFNIN